MNCSSLEGILSLVFHIPSWRQSLQILLVMVDKIMNLLNPTFGLRDKVLNDYISAIDEQKLNVRMQFKTIEDYFASSKESGYVEAEHLMGEIRSV